MITCYQPLKISNIKLLEMDRVIVIYSNSLKFESLLYPKGGYQILEKNSKDY